MSSVTPNIGLILPDGSENVSRQVINDNMSKVDAEVGMERGNIAANYSTSSAYNVGDLCIYQGNLYRCNTAIVSGEEWTAAHWTQVNIAGELDSQKQAIANLDDKVSYENTITDLNTATEAGTYYYGANSANAPVTNAGRLMVMKSSESSYGIQIASYNSASVPPLYMRTINPNGFGSWERVATIMVSNTGEFTTNSNGNYNFTSITPSGCFPIFPLNYPGYFGNGSSASYAPFLFGAPASTKYSNTLTLFIRYQ